MNNEYAGYYENLLFVYVNEEQIKKRVEIILKRRGYWSAEIFRYYLENNDWRIEPRPFGCLLT